VKPCAISAGDIEAPGFIESLPGPFDYIVLVDTLGSLDDCQLMFEHLHNLCTRETRLIVGYYSHLWYPLLKLAEALRLRMPQPPQNVLAPADVRSLALLADFEATADYYRRCGYSDWAGSLIGLLRRFRSFVAYVCGTTRFADHCGSSETHHTQQQS
jgi:hypothetical protein